VRYFNYFKFRGLAALHFQRRRELSQLARFANRSLDGAAIIEIRGATAAGLPTVKNGRSQRLV